VAFNQFRKIKVAPDVAITEKHINTVQDNVETSLKQVLGKDILDRRLLKNIVLLPGITNIVPHTLGRDLQGFNVVRNHGGYSLLTDLQDTNKSPHLTLLLTTPVRVVVDLEVF
jgi:hypothetical protein